VQGCTTNFSTCGKIDTAVNSVRSAPCKRQKVSLNIVPIRIDGEGGRFIETYAFIDQGSDKTFIDEKIVDWLKLKTKPVKYSISTVNGTQERLNGKEQSLQIKGLNGEGSVFIPRVIEKILVEVSSMPSKKDLMAYNHLKDIFLPRLDTREVNMLIGSDVTDICVPNEIRRGKPGEPCAQKSPLGWTVIGPFCEAKPNMAVVNFQRASDIIQLTLECMYNEEFNEISPNDEKTLSQEDHKAHPNEEIHTFE
jgi:hypothetical protein